MCYQLALKYQGFKERRTALELVHANSDNSVGSWFRISGCRGYITFTILKTKAESSSFQADEVVTCSRWGTEQVNKPLLC